MDRDNNKNEQERDFPGYPHYPSEEDITNPGNGNRKVNLDAEELANSNRLSAARASDERVMSPDEETNLDVPGAELDDKNEVIGEEDEENNYYSLGGDRHADLDERQDD